MSQYVTICHNETLQMCEFPDAPAADLGQYTLTSGFVQFCQSTGSVYTFSCIFSNNHYEYKIVQVEYMYTVIYFSAAYAS